MDTMHKVADSSLYTDFSDLARLRAKSTGKSDEAALEVAKQFESLFLQMMLKTMREASVPGAESAESDQTRFYQEMFDKQIAMDLVNKNNGKGIGLATMLEQEFTGNKNAISRNSVSADNSMDKVELIRQQVNMSTSSINRDHNSGQE